MRAQQADFLFTCKPESHATLYEWVGDFERNEQLGRVVQARRVGKKHFTDTYRYAHQVPLRNIDGRPGMSSSQSMMGRRKRLQP